MSFTLPDEQRKAMFAKLLRNKSAFAKSDFEVGSRLNEAISGTRIQVLKDIKSQMAGNKGTVLDIDNSEGKPMLFVSFDNKKPEIIPIDDELVKPLDVAPRIPSQIMGAGGRLGGGETVSEGKRIQHEIGVPTGRTEKKIDVDNKVLDITTNFFQTENKARENDLQEYEKDYRISVGGLTRLLSSLTDKGFKSRGGWKKFRSDGESGFYISGWDANPLFAPNSNISVYVTDDGNIYVTAFLSEAGHNYAKQFSATEFNEAFNYIDMVSRDIINHTG